ncbi:MAG: desulfoferrodoxin family protein [Fibrobacterota bacterium]
MSIEKKAVYYCSICKNLVESLWNGSPSIVCCGEEMQKLEPKKTDTGNEKHVPVVHQDGSSVTVKVGDVPHPMTKDHYILFIEVIAGDKVYRYDFTEDDIAGPDPVAEVTFAVEDAITEVREFCNIHGLWSTTL